MQSHPTPSTDGRSLNDLAAATADLAERVDAAATDHRGNRDSDGLDATAALLAASDRLTAAVITILQTTDHHDVIGAHGVTRDTWLRAIAGRTSGDAGMLLATAERLADMPAVTAWFHQGVLSWGAVRAIVAATRNLTRAQRGWVDATLADHGDDVARLDGDQVAAAVEGLANRARPELHRDRDTAALTRRWLSLQPRLDGTADIHGSLDPETAAAALAAFTATDQHDRHDRTGSGDHHGHDHGNDGDGDGMSDGDRVRAARRRSNVDIFGDLCRQRVTRHHHGHRADATQPHTDDPTAAADVDARTGRGAAGQAHASAADGDDAAEAGRRGDRAGGPTTAGRCGRCGAAPSTARPAMLVVADLSALDPDAPVGSGTARPHWATTRSPVEVTPATAQRLACDATLRAVITDGTDILGVTATHPKVSAALRAALVVHDGGCRFPGCSQPAELCDAHHLVPVIADGATSLANLALLCRDHHHGVHDGGWLVTLHDDATMTFSRRGVTRVSVPRARQHPTPTQPPPGGRPRRHHTRPPGHRHQPDAGPADRDGTSTDPDVDARSDPADTLLPF